MEEEIAESPVPLDDTILSDAEVEKALKGRSTDQRKPVTGLGASVPASRRRSAPRRRNEIPRKWTK
jgi:hypothetical protein